jgi:hypothetical protein
MKEWGFGVTQETLTKFFYENKADIDDRRIRFTAQEKDYYLSTGTGRIESLSYLYSELLKVFDKNKSVRYAAEIRSIIEQVRKEVKGDEIRLTVDGKIDITATVQANRTLQELNQKMPIQMFIVSLVAAKKGINPSMLMSQLGNSFYANYNGFNELVGSDEDMKLPSHFINNYDWNEISQQHKKKEEQATKELLNDTLSKLFKKEGVKYTGNIMETVRLLESKLSGEVVPEIVDIEPIEVTVVESDKPKVLTNREKLREILKEKQGVKNENK